MLSFWFIFSGAKSLVLNVSISIVGNCFGVLSVLIWKFPVFQWDSLAGVSKSYLLIYCKYFYSASSLNLPKIAISRCSECSTLCQSKGILRMVLKYTKTFTTRTQQGSCWKKMSPCCRCPGLTGR